MGITVIVDCNECVVRGAACTDCVVTVLLGLPGVGGQSRASEAVNPRGISLEQDERDAMEVLADVGLVPRLRLVTAQLPALDDEGVSGAYLCDPRRSG